MSLKLIFSAKSKSKSKTWLKSSVGWCALLLLSVVLVPLTSQAATNSNEVYGVTIDSISGINRTVTALNSLPKKMTVRVVFDEGVPATDYSSALNKLHANSYIMGELLDSSAMKQYSVAGFKARTDEYLNTLNNNVDIWEVGNEINGEWLGSNASVVSKMNYAYAAAKAKNKTTALTFYYNKGCYDRASNEMFTWINNNISSDMKQNLDYVWVSYYECDCNNLKPNWQQVFDQLHTIFPNAKLGMGETGTKKGATDAFKSAYLTRYYNMNITTPNYVGGYFWWYFKQDMVPQTKALWNTLYTVLYNK